jgi:hypothetical protein
MTYTGGDAFTNTRVYVDGVEIAKPVSWTNGSSASLALPSNPDIGIGTRAGNGSANSPAGYLGGMVSNPKIYNVALEASEVRKLYNLGRTGRSMVISDTAVGIGKVPEAQLDVRGNIKCDGLVNNAGMHWRISAATSAAGNVDYTLNGGNWFSSTASSTVYGIVLSTENNAPISAWDSVTGYFTAPEDGLYLIDLGIFINGLDSNRWGNFQLLYTDGTSKESQYTFYTVDLTADDTVGYSKTVYMKTGEKFSFYTGQGTVTLYLTGGPPGHTTMNVYKIS